MKLNRENTELNIRIVEEKIRYVDNFQYPSVQIGAIFFLSFLLNRAANDPS